MPSSRESVPSAHETTTTSATPRASAPRSGWDSRSRLAVVPGGCRCWRSPPCSSRCTASTTSWTSTPRIPPGRATSTSPRSPPRRSSWRGCCGWRSRTPGPARASNLLAAEVTHETHRGRQVGARGTRGAAARAAQDAPDRRGGNRADDRAAGSLRAPAASDPGLWRARGGDRQAAPRRPPGQGAGRAEGRHADAVRVLHRHRLPDRRTGGHHRGPAARSAALPRQRALRRARETRARLRGRHEQHPRGDLRRAVRQAARALRRRPDRGAHEHHCAGEHAGPVQSRSRHRLLGLSRGARVRRPGPRAGAGRQHRPRRCRRRGGSGRGQREHRCMRIFLAGATGVIGRRLVPLLVAEGHQVTGMTRARERGATLEAMGAEVAVADALDAGAVRAAVVSARPQAVIHQLTSLPRRIDPRKIERDFVLNDRLRSEGTRHLVAAAQAAGAERIVAQSIAFAYAPGPPGTIHGEQDALFVDAPEPFRRSARAVAELEQTVQDAAGATAAVLTRGAPGAYNVVDDDPAPVSAWLPALAQALAAPRPMRVPALLARLAASSYGVATMTRSRGASNA